MNNQETSHRSIYQHLSRQEMIRYKVNRMSNRERVSIQKHLEGCLLCTEALKGLNKMDELSVYRILKELKRPRPSIKSGKLFKSHEWISWITALIVFALLLLLVIYYVYVQK